MSHGSPNDLLVPLHILLLQRNALVAPLMQRRNPHSLKFAITSLRLILFLLKPLKRLSRVSDSRSRGLNQAHDAADFVGSILSPAAEHGCQIVNHFSVVLAIAKAIFWRIRWRQGGASRS